MWQLIKVCGLKNTEENHLVVQLKGLTHAGFIFVPSSPRYTRETFPTPGLKRTGVFVDTDIPTIKEVIRKHHLDVVQLHGNESPDACRQLRKQCEVIKAFGIAKDSDFKQCLPYHGTCDLFLFDTKTPLYGGSGLPFDWNVLSRYNGPTKFLLSGGIGLSTVAALQLFNHPFCVGLDLNSRFELEPGIKNHQLIELFIHELNNTRIFSHS